MTKNILSKYTVIAVLIFIIVSCVTLYSIRTATLKAAVINAENLAQVIKSGITSYMVEGKHDKSKLFLANVLDNNNVNHVKIIRSEGIQKQFGVQKDKEASDDLEKNVLKSGKTQYIMRENLINSAIKIAVPLKNDIISNYSCTTCHNGTKNEVLGAVSLELNISELKFLGINSFYFIPVILFLGLFYFWFILRTSTSNYEKSFEQLQKNAKENIDGKLKTIDINDEFSSDLNDFVKYYNKLIVNFNQMNLDIDKKLKGFIGYSNTQTISQNLMNDTKLVISNLSDLYQFKKEIEHDNTKEEIFNRLTQVLQNKFDLRNFTIFEIFKNTDKINLIKEIGECFYCEKYLNNSPSDCRCSRISKDVYSITYHKSCPFFENENKFFYCLNIDLSGNRTIVINFCLDSQSELEKLKNDILFIKSFIYEAVPSIEVKILMQALKDSAFTDTLTGLYNRKFLEEHTKKLIPQVKRDNKNIAVLLLDMDHFKAVNDEYGHDIGDLVLKEFARVLNENIRESDIAVRYGGEEFLILLVDVKTKEDAYNIANKIRQKVKENEIDVYAGNKLRKTVSVGLAMFPENGQLLESVIKNADIALYEAKNSGRDSVVVFEESQVSSVDLF